jgi:manganese transport protein
MYRKILVTLDDSPADETILPHVMELAKRFGSAILLLHVADGWAAQNYNKLELAESEEMKNDREHLGIITNRRFRREEFSVETQLALGNPPAEILKAAAGDHCDLIAMADHGHRLIRRFISRQYHHRSAAQNDNSDSRGPARGKNNNSAHDCRSWCPHNKTCLPKFLDRLNTQ